MIRVRAGAGGPVEEMDFSEFERRARAGEIAPQHEVCFPAVTGERFVAARELELFTSLYASSAITFQRYFHLGRIPYVTLGLIAALCVTYFYVQNGRPASTDDLLRLGAKSPTLVVELGQWWRLITANFLHVSGWHLGVNAFFLLNLGGPTEAIFRRLDYILVVVAATLGTTLLSAAASPEVSCGASGVVFGVWGAAAVFGVRHSAVLPDRYRRYFIFSVIPYAVVALYLGLAMEGVDNWGHLGGLVAGSAIAFFLPARLLEPRDRMAPTKIGVLAMAALLLAAGGLWPSGAGALGERYFARLGLVVPVPLSWRRSAAGREPERQTFAYENDAGVVVALEARQRDRPRALDEQVHAFVERDVAEALETDEVTGVRLSDPEPEMLAGREARRIRAEVQSGEGTSRADFILAVRGNFLYIVRFSAPTWLWSAYDEDFRRILASVTFVDPDELESARRALADRDTPAARGRLAVAQGHSGDLLAARRTIGDGYERWPENGELAAAEARLLWETDTEVPRACALVREAMRRAPWTEDLFELAVDLHRGCNEAETAERILQEGLRRFPGAVGLHERLQAAARAEPGP